MTVTVAEELIPSGSGSVVKIACDAAEESKWIPVAFNTGLLLDVPAGSTAQVEQATELPSVIADGSENDKFKVWSAGAITGAQSVDSIVIGATHVRLRNTVAAGVTTLIIRRA